MECKKHRVNLRKRVINAAIATIAAVMAINATSFDVNAVSVESSYMATYEEIAKTTTVIDITWEEYEALLRMTMAESGYCSYEMMNGCASAAVNQCIQNGCTMTDTLYRPGAFGDGTFSFRDSNGKWRPVELEDINETVVEAVNAALQGEDVTEGAIGFFAPEYCSNKTIAYFYEHISGIVKIENVIFFREWN